MSIEEARRAPVQRLNDRLSFGAVGDAGDFGSDVDDTMMDIRTNRQFRRERYIQFRKR